MGTNLTGVGRNAPLFGYFFGSSVPGLAGMHAGSIDSTCVFGSTHDDTRCDAHPQPGAAIGTPCVCTGSSPVKPSCVAAAA